MSKNAIGVEVFNGFNIKYPEYSVITPHTLQEFTIRTLTIEDEEKLKGSMLTPNKLAQHLNDVIFSCLVKKPDNIKTYQDFLNNVSIIDRDALMYGLYHVTYKDIHNYDVSCSKCENVNSVKVDFLKSFKVTAWDKNNKEKALIKEIPVKLEIAQGITAIIHQPTLNDEVELLNRTTFASEAIRDLSMQLLIIKKFEVDNPGAKTPDTIEDRDNILKGYKQLPAPDKKLITKAYENEFGHYGVEVECLVNCQKCGNQEKISIDLVRQFFRSIYQ